MKKYLPLLAGCLAAGSCSVRYAQKPLVTGAPENNKTYKVEYLFEHDGCKVYRFYDYGNYVYFTNCNGQTMARTDSTIISQNSTSAARH